MPRHAKPKENPLPDRTLVIDNGAFTIKAGFASSAAGVDDCAVIPNCIARDRGKRIWIGAQLEKCQDFGEIAFRRPVEKGVLVNWEAEKAIWDTAFLDSTSALHCLPQETNLILTEAPNTPVALQTNTDQIVFEEYEFASYSRWNGPALNAYNDTRQIFGDPASTIAPGDVSPAECLLVIDCGYSRTTISPLYKGKPLQNAVRRLDVGGKFLSNYLKELISLRHYNLLDETHLINEIKESVCFVTQDFALNLDRTWKGGRARMDKSSADASSDIFIDYVLPDYNVPRKGFSRPHASASAGAAAAHLNSAMSPSDRLEDYMTLGNERFTVPELLFHPDDVGLKQPGIAETVFQSLAHVPTGLWPSMLANILVVGGTSQLPGFLPRLETQLRQLAPSECVLRVRQAPDPVKSTWLGGARLGSDRKALQSVQVTRQEYLENGSQWLRETFLSRSK